MSALVALLLTSRNCLQVAGASWRTCQRAAERHGIPIVYLAPRLPAIPAQRLLEALEAEAAKAAPPSDEDVAERLRRQLGLKVRHG